LSRKVYIETYGCQMNISDTEVIASILDRPDYQLTDDYQSADIILVNTCAIREHAESRVYGRLRHFSYWKKSQPGRIIGVLGCMAGRLDNKSGFPGLPVDLLAGPDAYRNLPHLIDIALSGQPVINTLLSKEETYEDILPVRYLTGQVTAFVSIMRGCNNYCSYCVVPYARGSERSRNPDSIINEIRQLVRQNFKEVTLLGQNVNSYTWTRNGRSADFSDLLARVALTFPDLRIRFATSHPKDISDKIIQTVAAYPNICRHLHLPVQSGSDRMLQLMNRKYSIRFYLDRIESARKNIPECSITTDIIAGFCTESDEDHQDTLEMMSRVRFDYAYMFKYSEREGTSAQKELTDDVPEDTKTKRLNEIINLQKKISLENNLLDKGKVFTVLAEGVSKKSDEWLYGRNSQNKVIVFPKGNIRYGDLVDVRITDCSSATLIGNIL
jgi:tRNA-2-methylthio-N6-dimethylallyladenosine synthase